MLGLEECEGSGAARDLLLEVAELCFGEGRPAVLLGPAEGHEISFAESLESEPNGFRVLVDLLCARAHVVAQILFCDPNDLAGHGIFYGLKTEPEGLQSKAWPASSFLRRRRSST